MKHYSITMKLFANDGQMMDRQTIEFMPSDCKHRGELIKEARPNKKMIFCTFNALVDACIERTYEDCARWSIKATELDTASGQMRYAKFTGDADEVFVESNGHKTECGSKYDEYFDYWLF